MINHAIVFYQQGLKLKPDHLEINLQLGKLLAKQNKWERATVYFSRAVEIDSDRFFPVLLLTCNNPQNTQNQFPQRG
ncbi:tetratricopeptide repeat protein [Planktothrix sp.]|uniref:tetratricopeptide repeat protein n=1 Tax=Planktothrix sp. TaxID=3088171 RepID=UPI0038D48BAD